MRQFRILGLTAVLSISFLASCGSIGGEKSSAVGGSTDFIFVPPSKLGKDSYIIGECDDALSAYDSFAVKTIKSKELRSETNSVYSPFSHYLCDGIVASLLVNAEESTLKSLGAKNTEELASFVDKLVRFETLNTDEPDKYGVVEMANVVANFDERWSQEKVNFVTEKLHAAYLDDYEQGKASALEWKRGISHGKWENPSPIDLGDHITFISGLYIDMPFELPLNEQTVDGPFDGNGLYPFLKGETYGRLYEDEEVLAFSQSCSSKDYEIRYVMPKVDNLDDYIEENDYPRLFEKASQKGKYIFELPSLSISSEWSLSKLKKGAGLESQRFYRFAPEGQRYEELDSVQNVDIGFKYDGVKVYAESKIVMVPENEPAGRIALNRPFAFDIIGRGGVVLIHGRVRTLD